jgi:hypothetical protein
MSAPAAFSWAPNRDLGGGLGGIRVVLMSNLVLGNKVVLHQTAERWTAIVATRSELAGAELSGGRR